HIRKVVLSGNSADNVFLFVFFFQAEDGIRDRNVTGVQTCALPISAPLITPLISASQLSRSAVAAVMPPNPSILQVVSAPASAVSAQAPASGGVPAGTSAPVPMV